jgi:SAM-dependent methyltransferase
MIRIAATKTQRFVPRPRLLVADAFEGTLLGSEQFSAVCCLGSTLNHISDWHRLAQSVSDRLQSGGVFVFSFDNLFGIDVVARVVLREYSGYSRQFWQDVIIERAKAVWHGRPFHNHWQVGGPGYNLEVGLTYERMSSWERYLKGAGLSIRALDGVHILDCWNRRQLRASAGLLDLCDAKDRRTALLDKFDRRLGTLLHSVAANVIGVAVKD